MINEEIVSKAITTKEVAAKTDKLADAAWAEWDVDETIKMFVRVSIWFAWEEAEWEEALKGVVLTEAERVEAMGDVEAIRWIVRNEASRIRSAAWAKGWAEMVDRMRASEAKAEARAAEARATEAEARAAEAEARAVEATWAMRTAKVAAACASRALEDEDEDEDKGVMS